MGFFDSSSSSTTNQTQNNDKRVVLDGSSQGISGDSNSITVTTTDHDAIVQAVGVSSGAVKAANESLMSALYLASDATRGALSANTSAVRDALAATTGTARDAIAAIAGANRDSLSFASQVNRDSLDLASRGQAMIATNAAESLKLVGSFADMAFKFNDAAGKRVNDASISAQNLVGRAYETATAYQAEKQTADSKYLLYAAVAAVAIIAVRAL